MADQLEGLTAGQWATPSLCDAWTVRDVLAHLVVPFEAPKSAFPTTLLAARGSFHRASALITADMAKRDPIELVADLRRHADGRFKPPGLGSVAPLTDILVHGQDIRIPLGLADERPLELWRPVLDFLVLRRARVGFVAHSLPALRLEATDLEWTHGTGPVVRGPAVALTLTMLGRGVRAGELGGPGASTLRASMVG